ncbi:MAG: hypothetical protein KAG98_06705, partial [Lentisphaeria bacterium]|nr:hypothetical protein [Lentisphaeria bacterium]
MNMSKHWISSAIIGIGCVVPMYAQDVTVAEDAVVEVKTDKVAVNPAVESKEMNDLDEVTEEQSLDEVTEEQGADEELAKDEKVKDYAVTLELIDTRIQDVLTILAEQRPGTSILLDPTVKGNVTISLKDVPWTKALNLVIKPHNLEVIKDGENIFEIRPIKQAAALNEVDVELDVYTKDDLKELPDATIVKLYSFVTGVRDDLTVDLMRAQLIDGDYFFIKKLSVVSQPVVSILRELAVAAQMNYSFSVTQNQPVDATKPVSNGLDNTITLNLKDLSLDKVFTMVAKRGGFATVFRDGVWEVSPRQAEALQPLSLGHLEVKFVSLDAELLSVLRSVISPRGKVSPGKNKILVVKGTEDDLEAVRNTLAAMDKPTPQVMVEARFFDLADGSSSYIGIDWSSALGGRAGEGTTSALGSITEFNHSNGTGIFRPLDGTQTLTQSILSTRGFEATLHALDEDTGAKQLANPKIVVTSGQQAIIHIGEKTPIFKGTSSGTGNDVKIIYELDANFGKDANKVANLTNATDGGITDVFNAQGTPGYLDLGTMLTVAPTVKTDDQIYIKVIPNLTKQIGTAKAGDVAEYPILFTTKVYTEFTINSGQTIAIGGLVKEQEVKDKKSVPLLGDIPLIGTYLFSYESNEMQRSETVIFLTVDVVGATELKTKSGVPSDATLVDSILEKIRVQDATHLMDAPVPGMEEISNVPKEAPVEDKTGEASDDVNLDDTIEVVPVDEPAVAEPEVKADAAAVETPEVPAVETPEVKAETPAVETPAV